MTQGLTVTAVPLQTDSSQSPVLSPGRCMTGGPMRRFRTWESHRGWNVIFSQATIPARFCGLQTSQWHPFNRPVSAPLFINDPTPEVASQLRQTACKQYSRNLNTFNELLAIGTFPLLCGCASTIKSYCMSWPSSSFISTCPLQTDKVYTNMLFHLLNRGIFLP